jgi:molybdopterin-binding protein
VRKPDALAVRPDYLALSLVRVVALDVPGYTLGSGWLDRSEAAGTSSTPPPTRWSAPATGACAASAWTRRRPARRATAGRLGHCAPTTQEVSMQISARNQLNGTVSNVELGAVMAEVTVDVNGQPIVSAITRGSAERLGLAEGQPVTVFIKATEVLLGVDEN